jgi:hypothetical protein
MSNNDKIDNNNFLLVQKDNCKKRSIFSSALKRYLIAQTHNAVLSLQSPKRLWRRPLGKRSDDSSFTVLKRYAISQKYHIALQVLPLVAKKVLVKINI